MKKIALLFLSVLLISCGEENTKQETNLDGFNRKEMLTFWADQILIPGYKSLNEASSDLKESVDVFVKTPNIENLESVRVFWKKAYVSWQKVSLFQIGKAQELNLTANLNTYPTSTDRVAKYVKSDYDFTSPNLVDVQGFPALDYLLYGVANNQSDIVTFYSKNTDYASYLKAVSNQIYTLTDRVYKDWSNYRETFITNDGNTSTSSVDKVVNYYVIPFFEKQLREYKISIPSGVRTEIPLVDKVEGYYSKTISKELYVTSLNAMINFFRGIALDEATKGKSLQQYLEFLKREDLVTLINTKLDKVSKLTSSLQNDFSSQLSSKEGREVFLSIFDALQDVLKSFKPDMMSAMNIVNTSTDTDND